MFEEHENCLFQNEKNVVMNGNIFDGKPCINRESKSLDITIYLYSCYDEHKAPSICNTTVYLSQTKNIIMQISTLLLLRVLNNVLNK